MPLFESHEIDIDVRWSEEVIICGPLLPGLPALGTFLYLGLAAGDINVPRAASPGDIKLPRADSPEYKKVPRAVSPGYIYVQQGLRP